MSGYFSDGMGPEEYERTARVADRLAGSVRDLVAATVLTEIDESLAAEAIAHIKAATEIVASRRLVEDSYGVRFGADGTKRNWGNAVSGRRNPGAPPVVLQHDAESTWTDVDLGPAYEGPAGLVHGGIIAAILDQVLGSAAEDAGHPGMTGTLTIRYLTGTTLGPVRVQARLD